MKTDPAPPVGLEALRQRLKLYRDNVQCGYTERFENAAERFYRQTGFMAPGKSVPMEMRQDEGERTKAWAKFQDAERDQFVADLTELEAVLSAEPRQQEPTTLECPCCGDDGAVSDAEGCFYDGQSLVCGCPGHVSCDSESEPYISNGDEPCLMCAEPLEATEPRPPAAAVDRLDLESIKAREAAATKGPWQSGPLGNEYEAIACFDDGSWNNDLLCSFNREADSTFMAEARMDIPALIAEVERLRAALAAPREET